MQWKHNIRVLIFLNILCEFSCVNSKQKATMGKRYYCDYCDKIFPDNPTNRRNHLNGVQHRTMRRMYYDAFQGWSCHILFVFFHIWSWFIFLFLARLFWRASEGFVFIDVDDMGLRGHESKLFRRRFRLDVTKFVLSNRVINWNSLPAECVSCNTVDTFKSCFNCTGFGNRRE